jgi:hypothetical protein
MVEKIFKAALVNPELISTLSAQKFSRDNLLQGMQILLETKQDPPLFYTQLLSTLLKNHSKYNRRVLAFKDFNKNAIFSSLKKVFIKNFRLNYIALEPFGFKDSLVMIKTLALLREDEKYKESASDLLEYFADLVIRKGWDLSGEEAVEVLKSTWQIEGLPAVLTLSQMSKATLLPELKTFHRNLEFYQRKDEFFRYVQESKISN